jgi:tetratricopeptide (TPR) repeat protein
MKLPHLLLAIAAVCLAGNFALAQQTGDQIVAVAARTELRIKNVTTGTVPRGAILSVERVDGDRFWVRWSDREGTVKGWIARADVLPLSAALDLLDAELKKSPSSLNYRFRGAILAAKSKKSKAISDYTEAIRLNPRDPVAWRERGTVWMEMHEKDKAIADFDKAIRLDPKDAVSYLSRATAWTSCQHSQRSYSLADLQKTDFDFENAARLDPLNPELFVLRSAAWLIRGDFEKAIADGNHATELDPDAAGSYTTRGTAWLFQRKYDQARADFDEAIRRNPRDPFSYTTRAMLWLSVRKFDKAIEDFSQAIRLDPKAADAFTGRAMLLAACGAYDRAVDDFTAAITIDPIVATAWTNRAAVWQLTADYDKQLADCNEAIRLEPDNPNGYVAQGQAWSGKGEIDRAIASYNKAIELDHSRASAYLARGIACEEKRKLDQAIADFTRVISLCDEKIATDPQDDSELIRRAHAWKTMGDCEEAVWAETDYDRAIADYEAVIQLDPKDFNAYDGSGDVRIAKGEYAKAREAYDRALDLGPAVPSTFGKRAWLAATCPDAKYRNGKRAVEDATKACELTGWRDGHLLEVLAAACAEAGDFANAVKWETKAIERIAPGAKAKFAKHLDFYEHHKPYREATKK